MGANIFVLTHEDILVIYYVYNVITHKALSSVKTCFCASSQLVFITVNKKQTQNAVLASVGVLDKLYFANCFKYISSKHTIN